MRRIAICVVLLMTNFILFAQNNSRITGFVGDAITRNKLEYATVTIYSQAPEKVINGTVSDNKGSFELKDIPPGNYKAVIEFIGYTPHTIDSVLVDDVKKTIRLPSVFLFPNGTSLESVTLTAKAPIIENKIDKIIYNAANDITSQGGAAIDVLKKVPQVTVDINGNVELQGNSNIRFLINGKPSTIFGNSLTDALAAIPASQIKSIEAITSPGAKYDAQGTGGIINIILKESRIQGINGTVNGSFGTRLENGSVNLNYRHDNFGLNAFFGGNAQLSSRTPSSQDRLSSNATSQSTTQLVQNGYSDFERNGIQSGIGFDWNISKKNNISGSVGFFHFGNTNTGLNDLEQKTYDAGNNLSSDIYTVRHSNNQSRSNSLDWSLQYRKQFLKEGKELNIEYNSSSGNPFSTYIQTQNYKGAASPFTGSTSNNPGTDKETSFSIDYTDPVTENFLFETGVKTQFQKLNSAADVLTFQQSSNGFLPDPTLSYNFNFTRNIYAAYVSANFSLFRWLDIKAGARLEHTDTKIDYKQTNIPANDAFVPSVIFSHKLQNQQTVKLSYSHRIERPEYWELNPFINSSDPYNITTGNPLLLPELGNNFELGYSKNFSKGGNFYAGLFERINSQDLKPVTVFYPEYSVGDSVYKNVSVTNRQNIGKEYNSGLTVSGSIPFGSKFNLRTNILTTSRYIVSPVTGDVSLGLRLRFNLNATYQLPKDLILEGFGNFNSASKNIQGKIPQSITYTLAFRKQFWNKKASVGVTATNPFTKYVNQVTTIKTDNYLSYSVRQIPYRSFGLSFNWKFGKLEFKKQKEDENNYQDLPSQ